MGTVLVKNISDACLFSTVDEPDPEPEPEPDCLVKSSFVDELWITVPTTIGLAVSIFGE